MTSHHDPDLDSWVPPPHHPYYDEAAHEDEYVYLRHARLSVYYTFDAHEAPRVNWYSTLPSGLSAFDVRTLPNPQSHLHQTDSGRAALIRDAIDAGHIWQATERTYTSYTYSQMMIRALKAVIDPLYAGPEHPYVSWCVAYQNLLQECHKTGWSGPKRSRLLIDCEGIPQMRRIDYAPRGREREFTENWAKRAAVTITRVVAYPIHGWAERRLPGQDVFGLPGAIGYNPTLGWVSLEQLFNYEHAANSRHLTCDFCGRRCYDADGCPIEVTTVGPNEGDLRFCPWRACHACTALIKQKEWTLLTTRIDAGVETYADREWGISDAVWRQGRGALIVDHFRQNGKPVSMYADPELPEPSFLTKAEVLIGALERCFPQFERALNQSLSYDWLRKRARTNSSYANQ